MNMMFCQSRGSLVLGSDAVILDPLLDAGSMSISKSDVGRTSEEFQPAENDSAKRWWKGDLMNMTSRVLVALTTDCVVLCFSREDVGACKAADSHGWPSEWVSKDVGDLNHHEGLLPPLSWGDEHVFHLGASNRIELERLKDHQFVVCYERAISNSTACRLGVLKEGQGSCTYNLLPFGEEVKSGVGRLVSVSVASAGSRFAVCQQGNRTGTEVSCSWFEVQGSETTAKLQAQESEVFTLSEL